jgi:hypothetical protein
MAPHIQLGSLEDHPSLLTLIPLPDFGRKDVDNDIDRERAFYSRSRCNV